MMIRYIDIMKNGTILVKVAGVVVTRSETYRFEVNHPGLYFDFRSGSASIGGLFDGYPGDEGSARIYDDGLRNRIINAIDADLSKLRTIRHKITGKVV